MTRRANRFLIAVAIGLLLWGLFGMRPATYSHWTADEIVELESLVLQSLPPLPESPGNAVADSAVAQAMGERLFNDPRMSANGAISCATCHQPIRNFSDGLPKGQALGTVDRNTPSIVGMAYSPWQFWDGRADSLWAQALAPLEDENEHAVDRPLVAALISNDEGYRSSYESLFGKAPSDGDTDSATEVFVNVGKVIAAFERTLLPRETPFDRYVAALLSGENGQDIFTADEARGLQLFIGEADCTQCHNGPLLTNHEFHNTGVLSFPGELPDEGRALGVRTVLADPFNCLGEHSDAQASECAELEFVRNGPELLGAFKTPSLRNLRHTEPYMHKGQLATFAEVLEHYNEAPDAMVGHNESKPLGLSRRELRQLEAFLHTLAPDAAATN